MNSAKEKLIIENLFSSTDVFVRCISIIQSKYFSPEFRPCISFLKTYFEKYNAIPSPETIKAETNTDLEPKVITRDIFKYTCDSIEEFCKNSAVKLAIKEYLPEIDNGNESILIEKVKEAASISLQKDLGLKMYGDAENKLKSMAENEIYYSTGIGPIDEILDGGIARGTLTLVSANSGGGKSVLLANIGKYMSEAGLKVLYVSLELKQDMIYLRLASMISGVSTRVWKQEISTIAHEIDKLEADGAGDLTIKRLPSGTTANGIRSFLKLYELEYKELPDVLIVDYLDPMHPNEGIKGIGISEQDKLKSEQLVEILEEFNMIGLTASQQNREAIKNASPDQSIIAGGLSKINAVHNYISIFMDPMMRLNGEMYLYFLKTRTSMGHGQCVQVSFNPNNLIISGSRVKSVPKVIEPTSKKAKGKSKADELIAAMKHNLNDMPEEIKKEFAAINEDSKVFIETEEGERKEIDLLSLIHTI